MLAKANFLFPRFLFFENGVHGAVAIVTGLRDLAGSDGVNDRAAFLAEVCAIGIATLTEVGSKVAHGGSKVVERKKVEACKVEHTEARGIGKKGSTFANGDGVELNVPCGMAPAFNLAGKAARGEVEVGE